MLYRPMLLIAALAWTGCAAAAEKTALEKLCDGYERKQAMLQRRLKAGARAWEKEKIREEQRRVAAEQAKLCRPKTPAAGEARP